MSDEERRLLEAAAWLRSCTPAERAEAAFYADLERYRARATKAETDLARVMEELSAQSLRAATAEADRDSVKQERDALKFKLKFQELEAIVRKLETVGRG